eukprot:CAMPEP_0117444362 /NCGR_PEP_ID=MMETSP0759-20121206/5202_1 /TAXON_ID=63605 /ORGANISM="Percolomonas cosmopolitus, Strain WS" /LENGTH=676 /DNA_ID=CAMNT_0005236427 /DNA_START=252 /DNA_END=2282 /DNA_ORIENTATION=-
MAHVEYVYHSVHHLPTLVSGQPKYTLSFASKQMEERVLKHITSLDDELIVEHFHTPSPNEVHVLDESNVTILKRDTHKDSVYIVEVRKDNPQSSSHALHSMPPQSTKRKRKRLPLTASLANPQPPQSPNHTSTKKRKVSSLPTMATTAPPQATTATRTTHSNKYNYTDLSALKVDPSNHNVHIYGIIVDYTTPKSTSCDLFTMSISLTDPSISNRAQTNQIKVLLSAKLERLPRIKMVSQIFRAHRTQVRSWSGQIQVGNTPQSSFLVFDPQNSSSDTPQRPSSLTPNSTWEPQDNVQLKKLSRLAAHILTDHRFRNNPRYLKTLEALKYAPQGYPDIIAQIVHREERDDGMLLRIWDGTMYFDIGCIADLMIFSNQHTISDYLRDYPLKTFVKFRNIAFVKDRGLFTVAKSSVCVLPPNHQDALALQQKAPPTMGSQNSDNYEDEPPMPQVLPVSSNAQTRAAVVHHNGGNGISSASHNVQSPTPTTSKQNNTMQREIYRDVVPQDTGKIVLISTHPHDHVPVVSLAQVLQQSMCPAKFRVQVHVTGFDPLSYNYFSMPFCARCDRSLGSNFVCTQCKRRIDEGSFVWHFRFAMIVKCASSEGSLRVLVEKETAEKFLGMKPSNFVSDLAAREELAKRVRWMQFPSHVLDMCMEKYQSVKNRVVYRLCDTSLKMM